MNTGWFCLVHSGCQDQNYINTAGSQYPKGEYVPFPMVPSLFRYLRGKVVLSQNIDALFLHFAMHSYSFGSDIWRFVLFSGCWSRCDMP